MDKKNLTLKFESNNRSLVMDGNLYKIVSVEGLESSEYNIEVENNNRYDGGYTRRKQIRLRDISIIADFRGTYTEQERQNLISFFNPHHEGNLIVNYCGTERSIKYEVQGFKDNRANLYEYLTLKIDLVCPDPFFKTVDETLMQISTWIGGWKFKFKLPFRFKQRGESRKNIYNEGHVETPVEIIFKGPAVNPCVINHATGEFIKVERTLTTDDTLYITTEFGNKKVEIERNGVRNNAFNYIDLDSTFFQLKVGDNMIEYTTDNDLEPQSVEIRYRNRYLGV